MQLPPAFANFFLFVLFKPEDGGDKWIRNVRLSPKYMALQPRRPYPLLLVLCEKKGKAIPVTGRRGPIDLSDVEAPTFTRQSAHRWRWSCQPYAPAALYLQENYWHSFLLDAESTPGS
jgi:hypothetical protein